MRHICRNAGLTLCFVYAAIKEREQQAIIDGWRSRPYDLKVLKEYHGHEERAAWKLLDYEPKYRGYYKRAEARAQEQQAEVAKKQKASRTAARAQSPSSDSDSTASESNSPAGMADLPRSQPKDLLAKFKKKPGSSGAPGPATKAKPPAAGAPAKPAAETTAARRGPPEAGAPSPPKKRSKTAGETSGAPAAPHKKKIGRASCRERV